MMHLGKHDNQGSYVFDRSERSSHKNFENTITRF